VVITGMGAVTPLGNDLLTTWNRIRNGESGIDCITRFDASTLSSRIAGEVKGFNPLFWMHAKDAHKTDPFIQYALAAALMALKDASLIINQPGSARTGVLVGSGRGGVTTVEKNMTAYIRKGAKAVSSLYPPMSLVNMASGFIAIQVGARGPCLDVSTACATGTHAVGEAMKIIQRGDADIMIAGGAEAPLTPLVLSGFCKARALSVQNSNPSRASRPFDRNRDGFVLAEGAAVLVLESYEYAKKRDAKIYAELAGYGLTCDAYHYTHPDPTGDGSARAMNHALADAGIHADEIDYVNAHGTSTLQNDRIETRAIKKVFNSHAKILPVSSSKSMLGHMLGAAGAVEAAISVLALQEGIIPPTINYHDPDPECDLDYVPNNARQKNLRCVMSNSLGFGGMNAALVFKRLLD